MLAMVDADTAAFTKIMEAFRLPKATEEEKAARSEAIAEATRGAINTPLDVMKTALDSMEVMEEMSKTGLKASISDAGVGAMCALTAVRGAYLNVRINCKGFKDTVFVENALAKAEKIIAEATHREAEIMKIVLQHV
jgi:glutamate formiminotransferase/formiminotetrahydrofolate cyclodeaminase